MVTSAQAPSLAVVLFVSFGLPGEYIVVRATDIGELLLLGAVGLQDEESSKSPVKLSTPSLLLLSLEKGNLPVLPGKAAPAATIGAWYIFPAIKGVIDRSGRGFNTPRAYYSRFGGRVGGAGALVERFTGRGRCGGDTGLPVAIAL